MEAIRNGFPSLFSQGQVYTGMTSGRNHAAEGEEWKRELRVEGQKLRTVPRITGERREQ